MSGLNPQFMDNPENFLRSRAIVEALPVVPPPPRVVEFDLQPYEAAAAKIRGLVIGGKGWRTKRSYPRVLVAVAVTRNAQIQPGEDAGLFLYLAISTVCEAGAARLDDSPFGSLFLQGINAILEA